MLLPKFASIIFAYLIGTAESKIDAVLETDYFGGAIYFFRGDKYVKYYKGTEETSEERSISAGWPGVNWPIDAAAEGS